MNPWQITTPTLDLIAIARWNEQNRRSREGYIYHLARLAGMCTSGECERKAGVAAICWKCQREASGKARSDRRRVS